MFAIVLAVLVLAPFVVVGAAAFSGSWNGVFPSDPTTSHLRDALSGDELASLTVSLQTALLGGLLAVVFGTWAALASRTASAPLVRFTDALYHLPIAVPSVVVGLGLLVAFSRPPLLLNGTKWIVVIAHLVLMVAFTYGTVAAALQRTDDAYADVAASLGASPARVLWQVRLPMLRPAIVSAASLSVALSMGEVGATIMVYPASWRTLPVSVFALTDRGQTFVAAAESLVLLAVTVVLVVTLDRLRGRAVER
ncbi:2-aminoethylphosphonate transport system permease protein [Kribbella sp. VKM Ac-2527]|uniref:2-aminoethylphosphonate transport system permease protein n=1 Tax=Kribbella caucasensis TaxID=2512215 RepID=A0A4V3C9C7_9ACTN|nr:ABC transporter permease subunit [Kribbella sp. VKM Ac-2527]TDO44994.1 2-aminoethylphosphonate transport system permease protein [Kribbella sp. VKM Ac-2527]